MTADSTEHTRQLREQTGRPESECRTALMKCGGNFDIAKARLSASNHG